MAMTTKMIGIKKFRENITSIWQESNDKKIRYIVLYHSTPVLEVNPIGDEELVLEDLIPEVKKARQQIKKGEVFSEEEIMKEFGLKK